MLLYQCNIHINPRYIQNKVIKCYWINGSNRGKILNYGVLLMPYVSSDYYVCERTVVCEPKIEIILCVYGKSICKILQEICVFQIQSKVFISCFIFCHILHHFKCFIYIEEMTFHYVYQDFYIS